MQSDDPFVLEPARSRLPAGRILLTALIAFLLGAGGAAAAIYYLMPGGPRAPAPDLAGSTPSPEPARPDAAPATAATLPPASDLATLGAREQELAARLDRTEERLAAVDLSARSAGAYASQAERLLIAAAVRRAIERGQPLGPLEGQLRARFGMTNGDAVATLIQAARAPVMLEDLRFALETIAPRLTVATNEGLWERTRRTLSDLIVLRQAASPSPRPADRLARAEQALRAGQAEAAMAEVARLPGAASAQSWVGAARRYVAARQALTEIELAALATPAAAPSPAPAASPSPDN